MNKTLKNRIDWVITLIPFLCIVALCLTFFTDPAGSSAMVDGIRAFLGEEFGWYYLTLGLGIFLITLYMAFSRFGNIHLGEGKAQYSLFNWGAMMFTAGIAADILFYSLCEWMIYANEPHVLAMGSIQDWSGVFALFHWGPIPWAFYMALAVAFGFMIHVRKRNRQKYSEACRPLLGNLTDRWAGKLVDLLAVFALIAGTATTFSVSAPLLSNAVTAVFGIPDSTALSITILLVICILYTICAWFGIDGVSWMASACIWLFFALLAFVLVAGGMPRYILETGLANIGKVAQNFIEFSTYTDPLRETSFPQNWTIFYWAYWLVWCVASPFFMGSISRGRTVKQVILGAYIFGMSSTLISFVILGNYGLGLQMKGIFDCIGFYESTGDIYQTVIAIIHTLPLAPLVLVMLVCSMVAFYATSFDSITLVASAYSYKEIRDDEEASGRMKLFWAILLILLPIALIFSEGSMNNLQTVSIIAAFPIGLVILLIIASFIKDARGYLKTLEK